MAIRSWHGGKIILLWAWGIAACLLIVQVIVRTAHFVPGFLLLGGLLAILIALSAVTWKWLSGKEQ